MQIFETGVSNEFTREVALPESEMNLARAALLFAQSEYPKLNCDWYLEQLDLIADNISERSDPDALHRRYDGPHRRAADELRKDPRSDDQLPGRTD